MLGQGPRAAVDKGGERRRVRIVADPLHRLIDPAGLARSVRDSALPLRRVTTGASFERLQPVAA